MSFKPSLFRFKIPNFADLPHEAGKFKLSNAVKDAKGRPWVLCVYPGGKSPVKTPDSDDSRIGVVLSFCGGASVHAKATFIVKDRKGEEITHQQKNWSCNTTTPKTGWGPERWIERSKIINDMLDNEGALLVDVLIQIKPSAAYLPPNPIVSNLLALFDGEFGSDVTFKVGGHLVPAHKAIVRANSEILWDCVENNEADEVLVEGISKDAFVAFMRCFYGGNVSDSISVAARKDIILAADRYGAPQIKIAAEISLVGDCIMTDDNVCDWYEFSHYKTCPLLKEQAASYFILRGPSLLSATCSDKLKESPQLVTELMTEMCNQINGTADTVGVNELRKELADKGLDVDGSKEILMARLVSSEEDSPSSEEESLSSEE